jgi:hypothetical protein
MADILETNAETLNEEALSIGSVFQIRKRGVETKLIFADMPIGQAFELAPLKQGNLAPSGLSGMAGCAASPEPTSLGRNSLLTGKITGKNVRF